MASKSVQIAAGLFGVFTVCVFILGLAHSISVGFAGFWGGLPFIVIAVFVLSMVIYDFWDQCVRNEK